MIEKIKNFFREVKIEMSRVIWPSREELLRSTWIVIFMTFAFAIFIFIVDTIFRYLFTLIFSS
ncbi:preprotein translocase subunit SecE [bacterium BMS3Abin05]|nr:preprotein translocase subunit SecE [bacterium BMS3Abin05]GBE28790.1 preprotein translocase subunit SecE [bacterium BMS3Bbin03]HDL78642.1 preprotein translocase subunit SecE [Bacteroidota bacterium]HDZ12843.1 preprotein translocase subunit SecE [Bacteroidota bacterium]